MKIIKVDSSLNESNETVKEGYSFSDLRKALKRFDENGRISKQGDWKIAKGGYDLAFEIEYKGLPILGVSRPMFADDTEINLYNDEEVTKKAAEVVCQVYPDCHIKDTGKELDEDTVKQKESIEDMLKNLPHIIYAYKDEENPNAYFMRSVPYTTTRKLYNVYVDVNSALEKKFGNRIKPLEYIRNEWDSHQDRGVCLLRVEFKDVDSVNEDTVKQGNYWVNKGKEGTHGKFRTKKAADAQRKAMYARGFKESADLDEEDEDEEKPRGKNTRNIAGIPHL